MADIRIKDLATTASQTSSGDFIAIDGFTNGTRKLSANAPSFLGNITSGGVIADQGGTIAAQRNGLAPAQGLSFDGTAGANVGAMSVFGTANYSVAFRVRYDGADGDVNYRVLLYGIVNGWGIGHDNSGSRFIFVQKEGQTKIVTTYALPVGKTVMLAVVRSGTNTLTLYANGVSVWTGTDSYDYTVAPTKLGETSSGANVWVGLVGGVWAYNRALSAAEVLALYQSGAVASADYNTASNTALNVATFANSNIYPYGTFSGASTTGFTAVSNGTGFQAAFANTSITFKTGAKYRLTYTLTINSGAAPFFALGNPGVAGYSTAVQLSAGTNSVEVTTTGSGTSAQGFGFQHNSSAGNYAISNISLVPLGALLAPDSAQVGGGLTWYDVSGNAANITLPATGVSWSLPFSGNITAPTTTALTLAGGSSGASLVLGQGATAASATLTPTTTGGTGDGRGELYCR